MNVARKEAMEAIKTYEMEQTDKLGAEMEKTNVAKNNFDLLDSEFNNRVVTIQQDLKQNRDQVVDFIVEGALNVDIELPQNIKSGTIADV